MIESSEILCLYDICQSYHWRQKQTISQMIKVSMQSGREQGERDPMTQQTLEPVTRSWTTRLDEKQRRIQQVQPWMDGPILPRTKIIDALETLIVSGDRVVLEGDNQKQADFLSRSLVKV